MPTTDRDIDDDLPIWDTPLHDCVELASTPVNDDSSLVVYHPDYNYDTRDEWIQSTAYIDTYDAR